MGSGECCAEGADLVGLLVDALVGEFESALYRGVGSAGAGGTEAGFVGCAALELVEQIGLGVEPRAGDAGCPGQTGDGQGCRLAMSCSRDILTDVTAQVITKGMYGS